MSAVVLTPLAPGAGSLHSPDRIWTETNCYVDLWIEVLQARGLEAVAAAAFTLSGDFDGDQWTFFKFPPEDLRELFGIEVAEMGIWQTVLDHVVVQLGWGRLTTVEVDSYFLPDTAGVAYRQTHTKTTIVPWAVDIAAGRCDYFHNAGSYSLGGADFDGLFRRGEFANPDELAPYVELIKFDRLRRDSREVLAAKADALLTEHLHRAPVDNPIARLGERIVSDLPWLAGEGAGQFHSYAFVMCRQPGASAELAASLLDWLAESGRHRPEALLAAAESLRTVAAVAKSLQFVLAKAARGRTVEVRPMVTQLADEWARATSLLLDRCSG